jgi:site-specific DNA-adenine methylase
MTPVIEPRLSRIADRPSNYQQTFYRPIVRTHGGKTRMCRRILSLIRPGTLRFLDATGGGGSMPLNSTCPNVHYNDLDVAKHSAVIAARENCGELLDRLKAVTYSEESFKKSQAWLVERGADKNRTDLLKHDFIDIAFHAIVRSRMSRGGLGNAFAWSERLRGGQPGDLNGWITLLADLPRISQRFRSMLVTREDFLKVTMQYRRDPAACVYIDPTYLVETRTAKKAYGPMEMTPEQHEEMLRIVQGPAAQIMISGYDSKMYRTHLDKRGWRRVEFEVPNNSGQGKTKQRRLEIVWISPEK